MKSQAVPVKNSASEFREQAFRLLGSVGPHGPGFPGCLYPSRPLLQRLDRYWPVVCSDVHRSVGR